jgi:type 1 glutamine amidotransferase/sugar phosphate isomerase/epimerase
MRTAGSWILIATMVGSLGLIAGQTPPASTAKPEFQRAPDALERVTWRTRTLVGDDRLTNWRFAISTSGLQGETFLEAVVRADAAVANFVEGSSVQPVSRDLQKPLDPNLTAAEISVIRSRMGTIRMLSYRADRLSEAAAARRKLFEFAKAMAVDTIVVASNASLDTIEKLADEFAINVAVLGEAARPHRVVKALEGRSKRLGVGLDTGLMAQEGVTASEALDVVKNRLSYVNLRDRSARGTARNVVIGQGVGNLREFFHELNRRNLRPLILTLDTAGVVKAQADLFRAVDGFEAAVQPAYGAYFTEFSRSRPIRWDVITPGRGETLAPSVVRTREEEVRKKIDAAIPRQAYASPKKRRKLLVIESLHGMSHNTIPHTNVMLEQLGKITGAWETEFNNDLNNLKYPKINDYDGVFLNSIVGELLADLTVRDGLARFVREGSGLGGVHGTPWASRNWEEFAEMIGAQSAPHRIEQGVMKVYDPASPIMKPFAGKDLNFREEYYRFEHEGQGRLRWDKVRVLLTVALDDPSIEPRPWTGYKRPDNVYPVTWIRSYGNGRVFYCSLGHMPETFMTPEIVGHFLAGVQFLLGDLEADTTPNPLPAGRR